MDTKTNIWGGRKGTLQEKALLLLESGRSVTTEKMYEALYGTPMTADRRHLNKIRWVLAGCLFSRPPRLAHRADR
jgi:hypothetical protein